MARYEHSPRHVIEARYLGDYKVWLEFNDGRKGVVDLADELYGDELRAAARPRSLRRSSTWTTAWHRSRGSTAQDFAPEFLYEQLKAMH